MNAKPPPPVLDISQALAVMDEEKTELDKVLELLLRPENIAHNTELSRNEITAFSVLGAIWKAHPELTALGDFLEKNLVYRVSKGRQGRKEWVKITSRQLTMADQAVADATRPGSFGRFFKGGKR